MTAPTRARTAKKATRRSRAPGAFNQSTREVLLEHAEDLVATRGPTEFRLTDLAARLGINVSSIFSHFPQGRQEIVDELVERALPAFLDLFPETEQGDPEVLLSDGVAALVLHLADHPGQARIILLDLSQPGGLAAITRKIGTYGNSLATGGLSEMAHRFERILSRGEAAGIFRQLSVHDVFQMMLGVTLTKVIDPHIQRSTAARMVVDAVLRFVRI